MSAGGTSLTFSVQLVGQQYRNGPILLVPAQIDEMGGEVKRMCVYVDVDVDVTVRVHVSAGHVCA